MSCMNTASDIEDRRTKKTLTLRRRDLQRNTLERVRSDVTSWCVLEMILGQRREGEETDRCDIRSMYKVWETERGGERHQQSEDEGRRERERQTDRQTDRHRERDRDREERGERQTDRQTHTERQRGETERERQRERGVLMADEIFRIMFYDKIHQRFLTGRNMPLHAAQK